MMKGSSKTTLAAAALVAGLTGSLLPIPQAAVPVAAANSPTDGVQHGSSHRSAAPIMSFRRGD